MQSPDVRLVTEAKLTQVITKATADANVLTPISTDTTTPSGSTVGEMRGYLVTKTLLLNGEPVTVTDDPVPVVLIWTGSKWIGGAGAPATPDTTAPVWAATLTTGTPTSSADGTASVVIAASELASDDRAVAGYYYRLTGEAAGTRRSITRAGQNFTLSGLAVSTSYAAPILWAEDAAGNRSAELVAQGFTTPAKPKSWTPFSRLSFTAPDGTLLADYVPDLGPKVTMTDTRVKCSIVGGKTQAEYIATNYVDGGFKIATTNADFKMRISLRYVLGRAQASTSVRVAAGWGGGVRTLPITISGDGKILVATDYATATETSGITALAPASGLCELTIDGASHLGQTWTLRVDGAILRTWTVDWKTGWGTPPFLDAAVIGIGGGDVSSGAPISGVQVDDVLVEVWR